jgi:hypothetical protein
LRSSCSDGIGERDFDLGGLLELKDFVRRFEHPDTGIRIGRREADDRRLHFGHWISRRELPLVGNRTNPHLLAKGLRQRRMKNSIGSLQPEVQRQTG